MSTTLTMCMTFPSRRKNGDANTDERPEADDIDSYDKLIGATFVLDPLKTEIEKS